MVVAAGCATTDDGTTTAAPTLSNVTTAAPEGTTADNGNTNTPVNEEATYTYNYAMSAFPTNWNPHQYQTAIDSEILDYASAGFYTFDYNDAKDGYQLVPSMATAEPVDVTADYVGSYGITEGESARAWKITLKDNIKWDDGTLITASDFVESAKLLLDPVAQNYRADTLYQGNLSIVNAKNYLYAGQHAYIQTMISAGDEYVMPDELETDENGYYVVGDSDLGFKPASGGVWSSNSLQDYYDYGYFTEEDMTLWDTVIVAAADETGVVKVNADVRDALMTFVAHLKGYADVAAYAEAEGDYASVEWEEFLYLGHTYESMDFSEVGMFAPSDTELVIVLEKPLSGFYLLYSLTSSWLVKQDLYESCMSVKDGVYTNTYGTSVDTFASYGPYKLTAFQQDKQYTMEKNEYYFDASDDTYQTTAIVVDCVDNSSTRLEKFLNGELDTYGLNAEDMESYSASDYTYYATGDSTFFVALNPDKDALEAEQAKLGDNYNKTILTVKEFRQALSYALDRASFALATLPTNSPAFGIFSTTIISDPENGIAYRTTEQAKQVLVNFWGLADDVGEGKLYATVDEAVESITGYNLEMAREYFDIAYDKAIEAGLMDEDDVVSICIGIPSTSTTYTKGNDFLVNCYTDAVKGTKLEGKLEFTLDDTIGNDFATALQNNKVNLLFFVGWTGSALDPYGLMEAYTSADYQYDPSWDTTVEKLTVTLTDGVDYTATVWDWTEAIAGTEITIMDADGNAKAFSAGPSDGVDDDRFLILAALEGAVLSTYDLLPLVDDSSAQMKGMQINYYTEDYIFGLGFGGIKYYTYNYTDAQWDEYVKAQGGTLNYK